MSYNIWAAFTTHFFLPHLGHVYSSIRSHCFVQICWYMLKNKRLNFFTPQLLEYPKGNVLSAIKCMTAVRIYTQSLNTDVIQAHCYAVTLKLSANPEYKSLMGSKSLKSKPSCFSKPFPVFSLFTQSFPTHSYAHTHTCTKRVKWIHV